MKKLILQRVVSQKRCVEGVLCYDYPICLTLEPPWIDNKQDISCIPAGVYNVRKSNSLKFGKVWELQNVPERSEILFHIGNIVLNTRGCILVGSSFGEMDGEPGVFKSKVAMQRLWKCLSPDEEFELEIKNP